MNPNMAFYAVNTKIATKKGRILSKGDWNKFIECGSVEQLADLMWSLQKRLRMLTAAKVKE